MVASQAKLVHVVLRHAGRCGQKDAECSTASLGSSFTDTTVRTELIAGLTTFLTMAYIVVVNPVILGAAGMPMAGVAAATCFAAAFGSIFMGLVSNYPLALAPGMGLNAYFTYTVVKGMGVPWQTALGCVFLSGHCVFLPDHLRCAPTDFECGTACALFAAVAGGVGLFIAFIGLADAGVIVAKAGTMVGLGNLTTPTTALAVLGLLLIAALQAWRVKGAILLGILVTAGLAWAMGIAHFTPGVYQLRDLSAAALKLDVPAALNLKGNLGLSLLEIILVFLLVDLFDNVGTLVAVTKRAGLTAPDGSIPRLNRILIVDLAGDGAGCNRRNQPGHELYRKRGGCCSRGAHRAHECHRRNPVPVHVVFCTAGSGHPHGGDGAGAHFGRRHDDGCTAGSGLDRSARSRPSLPHGDHDPAELLDRERAGFRDCQPCDP